MTLGLFAHRPESVITKAIALLLSDEENRAAQRRCSTIFSSTTTENSESESKRQEQLNKEFDKHFDDVFDNLNLLDREYEKFKEITKSKQTSSFYGSNTSKMSPNFSKKNQILLHQLIIIQFHIYIYIQCIYFSKLFSFRNFNISRG